MKITTIKFVAHSEIFEEAGVSQDFVQSFADNISFTFGDSDYSLVNVDRFRNSVNEVINEADNDLKIGAKVLTEATKSSLKQRIADATKVCYIISNLGNGVYIDMEN